MCVCVWVCLGQKALFWIRLLHSNAISFRHFIFSPLLHIWTRNPNKCLHINHCLMCRIQRPNDENEDGEKKTERWKGIGNVRIEFYLFSSPKSRFIITLCSPEQILNFFSFALFTLCFVVVFFIFHARKIGCWWDVFRWVWAVWPRYWYCIQRHQICMALSTPFTSYPISLCVFDWSRGVAGSMQRLGKKNSKTGWHTDHVALFDFGGPVTRYSCSAQLCEHHSFFRVSAHRPCSLLQTTNIIGNVIFTLLLFP